MSKLLTAAATVLGLSAITAACSAQCAPDDGFDIGCCQIPTVTLPAFPAVTLQANWAELRGCTATNQSMVTVALSAPALVYCDYALMNVSVLFASGETIVGTVAAKYARTFLEFPTPSGQVFRFLINGDLACSPNAAATPCTSQFPRCAFVPGQAVHFDGHVDYRCAGTAGGFTASMSLTHHQGCISHASWSCIPMSGLLAHTESSWHLVGPSPFIWTIGALPQGPLLGDAVRTSILQTVPTFNYQCRSEIKSGAGSSLILTLGSPATCLCSAVNGCTGTAIACPALSGCYQAQTLNYTTCCAPGVVSGPFSALPLPGTPVSQSGMVALRLGAWGALPQYPGNQSLTIYFSVLPFSAPAVCAQPNWPVHCAVGVATTLFGQTFNQAPACLPPFPTVATFLDLMNCLPLNASFPAPGYGCLAASDVVWSFNTP